jgi:hypothetical protein
MNTKHNLSDTDFMFKQLKRQNKLYRPYVKRNLNYSHMQSTNDEKLGILAQHIDYFGAEQGASYLAYLLHKKSFNTNEDFTLPFDYVLQILTKAILVADDSGINENQAEKKALVAISITQKLGRLSIATKLDENGVFICTVAAGKQAVHHFSCLPSILLYYTAEIAKYATENEYDNYCAKLSDSYPHVLKRSVYNRDIMFMQNYYYSLLLTDNNQDEIPSYAISYHTLEGQSTFSPRILPSYTFTLIDESIKPIYDTLEFQKTYRKDR